MCLSVLSRCQPAAEKLPGAGAVSSSTAWHHSSHLVVLHLQGEVMGAVMVQGCSSVGSLCCAGLWQAVTKAKGGNRKQCLNLLSLSIPTRSGR